MREGDTPRRGPVLAVALAHPDFSLSFVTLLVSAQAAPATLMSLATNLTSVVMGRHYENAMLVPSGGGWTGARFCYMLGLAVEYMQNPDPDGDFTALLPNSEFGAFLLAVRRCVICSIG